MECVDIEGDGSIPQLAHRDENDRFHFGFVGGDRLPLGGEALLDKGFTINQLSFNLRLERG